MLLYLNCLELRGYLRREMEDLKELRWNCPNCKAEGAMRSKERIPQTPMLHCEACDLYLDWYGRCHFCGVELFLTDSDVDDALEGRQVFCAKCQQPLNTDMFKVGTSAFVWSAIPVPELVVRLNLPRETDFIKAAKSRLAGDHPSEQRLGVYHCSTAFRARASSRYLQILHNIEVPFSLVMYNYDPATSNRTLKDDEHDFDFEMNIFGFVMNARSTFDVLAHEINFVYRYTGATHHGASFFDYTNAKAERQVNLQIVRQTLQNVCPNDPLTTLLDSEMNGGCFRYLTNLRDVNYHRRILIGPREARYSLKKFLRIRPTEVKGEELKMFLPDEPRLLWWNCTFNQSRELRVTFSEIESWLYNFLDKVYEYLAVRMK